MFSRACFIYFGSIKTVGSSSSRFNVTLISESPLLEHDAVYIRLQVEKAIMKRTGREEADYRDIEKNKWKKN